MGSRRQEALQEHRALAQGRNCGTQGSTSRASLPSTASRGRARPYTSRRRPCWHRAAPRDHAREGGLLLPSSPPAPSRPSPPSAPLVFFSLPGCRTCLLPAVVRGGQTNLSLKCMYRACVVIHGAFYSRASWLSAVGG